MSQTSKLLTDEIVLAASTGLKKLGKYGAIASKLQIIIAAKKHGISAVCKIHDISRTTLTTWIKELREGKIEELANKPKKARSVLNSCILQIQEWITEDPNLTAKAIVIKVSGQFGIKTSRSSIYRVLHKLKLSHITPRPSHYKKPKNSENEFKKKSRSGNFKAS